MGRVLPCLVNIADKASPLIFLRGIPGEGTTRASYCQIKVLLRPNPLKAYDHENSFD
jgi:hypothetical protein